LYTEKWFAPEREAKVMIERGSRRFYLIAEGKNKSRSMISQGKLVSGQRRKVKHQKLSGQRKPIERLFVLVIKNR
jgi:hypothetical protein